MKSEQSAAFPQIGETLEVGNTCYIVKDVVDGEVIIEDGNMFGSIKLLDIVHYDDSGWSDDKGYWCHAGDVSWNYNPETQAVLKPLKTPVENVYQYNDTEQLKKLLQVFNKNRIIGYSSPQELIDNLSKHYGLVFVWSDWDSEYDYTHHYMKVIEGAIME